MVASFLNLANELGLALKIKNWKLATAESCTGGGLAYWITSIAGSSDWFDRGFITYSNAAKQDMLGIPSKILNDYGAVSQEIALEMAQRALSKANADVSIAITGIAGPSGGSTEKPVGTVWIAWCTPSQEPSAKQYQFQGNRAEIRDEAIHAAMSELLFLLNK